MRREFISWVKPLGQYVCRLGKRFFARPKNNALCRQLHYYRRLKIEPLGAREMLTTFVVDQNVASRVDLGQAVFLNPAGGSDVMYTGGDGDTIVIKQTTTGRRRDLKRSPSQRA